MAISRSTFRQQKRFTEPSQTRQAFAEQCNINKVMRKYEQTGQLPITNERAQYLNNRPLSYHEAMQLVVEGQQAFDQQPAEIRKRFANSPEEFMAFIGDPENADEAVKLGIFEKVKRTNQADGDPGSERSDAPRPQNEDNVNRDNPQNTPPTE